ncbi:hypothetical protein ET495_17045 [Xylanimonas allomyrinae]|uniref:Roadblock/LAMTOR2 domain-containing protein n=1 Tax=Xylanimonas allomyrinae TaxID=2509459 RepID=A0A4P6ERS4_9MICO|nr:hypothetical protein [Xylanimonas allomyrinae]QAY64623.1 hypothetical protein ET495_17045 [Xylanimonas allomyrinae]
MGSLDDVMRTVIDAVDGALAGAVIDVETGALLGAAHEVPYFTQDYLDAVAAAAIETFRGASVTRVEELIAQHRGVPPEHLVEEVQVTTRGTLHFLTTVPERPDVAIVLVIDRRSSTGMGWAATRRAAAEVSPLLDAPDAAAPGSGGAG